MREFYEKFPYPRIPLSSVEDLFKGAHSQVMRSLLSTARIEPRALAGKHVLDAGCGTGEKALYFAALGARVHAIDISRASLKEAREKARALKLSVDFELCDLFELKVRERYDHVFCIGVLHHTREPELGFKILARAVKRGGTLTLGLYNAYGKLWHRALRFLHTLRGSDLLNELATSDASEHAKALLLDKWCVPIESYHTLEEVFGWFEKQGFRILGVHPRIKWNLLLTQLEWLLKRKGFFFFSCLKIAPGTENSQSALAGNPALFGEPTKNHSNPGRRLDRPVC